MGVVSIKIGQRAPVIQYHALSASFGSQFSNRIPSLFLSERLNSAASPNFHVYFPA